MSIDEMLGRDFGTIGELIRIHAKAAPDRAALLLPPGALTYAELDALMDRVAAALTGRQHPEQHRRKANLQQAAAAIGDDRHGAANAACDLRIGITAQPALLPGRPMVEGSGFACEGRDAVAPAKAFDGGGSAVDSAGQFLIRHGAEELPFGGRQGRRPRSAAARGDATRDSLGTDHAPVASEAAGEFGVRKAAQELEIGLSPNPLGSVSVEGRDFACQPLLAHQNSGAAKAISHSGIAHGAEQLDLAGRPAAGTVARVVLAGLAPGDGFLDRALPATGQDGIGRAAELLGFSRAPGCSPAGPSRTLEPGVPGRRWQGRACGAAFHC